MVIDRNTRGIPNQHVHRKGRATLLRKTYRRVYHEVSKTDSSRDSRRHGVAECFPDFCIHWEPTPTAMSSTAGAILINLFNLRQRYSAEMRHFVTDLTEVC